MTKDTLIEIERIYQAIDKDALLLVIFIFATGWFIRRAIRDWRAGSIDNTMAITNRTPEINITSIKDSVTRIESEITSLRITLGQTQQTATALKQRLGEEHKDTRAAIAKIEEYTRKTAEGVAKLEEALTK